jgi:3-oxoacyl-[acyl-carrier-protein] synthase I
LSAPPIFVAAFSAACALGAENAAIAVNLFAAEPRRISGVARLSDGRAVPVGRLPFELTAAPGETRTNRILAHCYERIADDVAAVREACGADRLGVVMGTSTSGIGESTAAIRLKLTEDRWPPGFSIRTHQLGEVSALAAELAGARGPRYTVSTACTSGARALASGARLIRSGLCDAVLCGGVDALCDLTLNGFASLDSLSDEACNPMSANRMGINIGEGGALFLLTRAPGAYRLAGWGESSDSHHISAPDPSGKGAEIALRKALAMAGDDARDIGFVHLHGTATRLNDAMEAGVVHRVFGADTLASSTKPMTGHTLGAAGALQAAFCLMAMEEGCVPPHLWDGVRDPDLPELNLAPPATRAKIAMAASASYAFGGNNAALILAEA